MPVFAPRGVAERYPIGLTCEKPRLGKGNGGVHRYAVHYQREGFGGYCYLTLETLYDVLQRLVDDGVRLEGSNLLHMSGRKDNPTDQRKYYLFFRRPGDAFMFKTYLAETSEIGRTNRQVNRRKTIVQEPYLVIW